MNEASHEANHEANAHRSHAPGVDSMTRTGTSAHASRSPRSLVSQGAPGIDSSASKHRASTSNTVDEDRFTHACRDVASRFTHKAMSQVLYAGSNVESKSHENENFHEQTLLSLMKRWYKPI
jgi:transcription initiation factor TFIID subunit TAF12